VVFCSSCRRPRNSVHKVDPAVVERLSLKAERIIRKEARLKTGSTTQQPPSSIRHGNIICSIKRLMIEKISGRVASAVMRLAALGVGTEERANPWNKLTYGSPT